MILSTVMTNLDARDAAIRSIGCLACILWGIKGWTCCDKHHLNEGDQPGRKRRGELFTVGLCRWHHVGACACPGKLGVIRDCSACERIRGPSWVHHKRRFLIAFGTGDELLAEQNRRIAIYYGVPTCLP